MPDRTASLRPGTVAKALRTEAQGTREVLAAGDISVEQATMNAIKIETLARMMMEIRRAGGEIKPISANDLDYWRKLHSASEAKARAHNDDVWKWTWRHYMALMERGLSPNALHM